MRPGPRFITIALLATIAPASAQDWPQWRGPSGQGVTSATDLPPRAESSSLKVRWKTPIPGEGCSSPIVHQGRVYLTTAYEGEERHPYDRPAALLIIGSALAIAALALPRVRLAMRALGDGTRKRRWLIAWTVLAVVLTVVILAKPKWFWQFADPWSGTTMTAAEFPFVEALYLRPITLFLIGMLLLVFRRFVVIARRTPLPEHGEGHVLARWMALVTVCGTLASAIAAALMGWRPDWFWQPGQPWLAWLASNGVALFALAISVGWFAEGSWLRIVFISAAIALVGWLFLHTPSDQFASSLDWKNRLSYVVPATVLLIAHGIVFLLARGNRWPRTTTTTIVVPVLAIALGITLFIRSNELHVQTGMVRAVVCLDANNGTLLWQTPVYVAPAEKAHAFNSHATPTPATDGEFVYAYFGSGLAALDKGGNVRWLNRDPDYGRFSRYGTGSSIALAGDLLIVYRDSEFLGHGDHFEDDAAKQPGRRASALIAFDKKTGTERWRVSPEFSHDSYMTPLVWTRGGELEVVVATWKTLAGFAVKDGLLRWKHAHVMQQVVPSLAVHGEVLFVTGGNDLPCPIFAVRAPTRDKPSETVWAMRKGGGTMVSPVCWDGLLFTISHVGVLSCRSADTGEHHWSKRLGGRYLGSIAAGDGKVYAVDQEGTLFVVAADRRGAVLAEYSFYESCATTPALTDGCVFVRTARHLYCLGGD